MPKETLEDRIASLEDDENVRAVFADEKSPAAMLAVLAATAPSVVQQFINERAALVLHIELPKLKAVIDRGVDIAVADTRPLAQVFEEAMERIQKDKSISKRISATVRDAGRDIAESVDKATRRVLLSDTKASRMALMDLAAAHARMVRALSTLAFTEDELAAIEERDSARA